MSYKKATYLLPQDLLEQIQEYVDGEFIYIPRISENKREWGSSTRTRQDLEERNTSIYADYKDGIHMEALSEKYFLSIKSIQRIVGKLRKENHEK